MTDLRAEAISLINQMPDTELVSIMSTLRDKAKPVDRAEKKRRAQAALKNLEKYFGRLPADFDYKKELEEVREEKLRRYENLG